MPHMCRGICYIEYATPEEADSAIKHMDGGQIDGQEISVVAVLPQKMNMRPMRRMSPPMRMNNRGPPPRWRSPMRFRGGGRRSPPRRNMSPRRRQRSRSPIRRRRHSNSSDSSR